MSHANGEARDLYALLIGIDCYMPNRLSDGTFYLSLKGCVRDVSQVGEYLHHDLGVPAGNVIKLTATDTGAEHPAEAPAQWPTYENIVTAFRRLGELARPGEHVYIHYSGHGGRAAPLPRHRKLIPHKFIDETLVPTDIGDSEGRYLRDIELAFLLNELVEKGLLVTLVLDSCHSGSATRGAAEEVPGGEAVVRGSGTVDATPRPGQSLVASEAALAANWLRLLSGGKRDFAVGSGWLGDPRGYVLLAACRAHEGAYEFPFDGKVKNGALTYWLLDSLKKFGGATYRALHQRIYAKVNGQFPLQTPQLEGEGDRVVFGHRPVGTGGDFTVLKADDGHRGVVLNVGQVHGVGPGAVLAIFRAGAAARAGEVERVAVVEISEAGATSSQARFVWQGREAPEQGDQAVLLSAGAGVQPRSIRLRAPAPGAREEADARAALAGVEELLVQKGENYLRAGAPGTDGDYLVSVNEHGELVIGDAGGSELPNLGPRLNVRDPHAPARVYDRLLHVAKYRNVLELRNANPASLIASQLTVELRRAADGGGASEELSASLNLIPGELIFLRARNRSPWVLNVTVLDLRPDWSVKKIFPSGAGLFDTLESEREIVIPLRADLPRGCDEGTDVLKVFATLEAADLRCLELPPINTSPGEKPQPPTTPPRPPSESRSASHLSQAIRRDMEAIPPAGADWAAVSVEARIRRG